MKGGSLTRQKKKRHNWGLTAILDGDHFSGSRVGVVPDDLLSSFIYALGHHHPRSRYYSAFLGFSTPSGKKERNIYTHIYILIHPS